MSPKNFIFQGGLLVKCQVDSMNNKARKLYSPENSDYHKHICKKQFLPLTFKMLKGFNVKSSRQNGSLYPSTSFTTTTPLSISL